MDDQRIIDVAIKTGFSVNEIPMLINFAKAVLKIRDSEYLFSLIDALEHSKRMSDSIGRAISKANGST